MSEPFLGQIQMFGFNFNPRGWAQCDGQLLPIAQNSALFSLLGTIYGGDGRTTFALPDLRGRAAIHQGNGPGLTPRQIGSRSGSERVTLNETQIPSHDHGATSTANAVTPAGNANVAEGNVWANDAGVSSATYSSAATNATMGAGAISTTVQNAGGGQPHENMQPFLTVNFCIALQGLFPSRN